MRILHCLILSSLVLAGACTSVPPVSDAGNGDVAVDVAVDSRSPGVDAGSSEGDSGSPDVRRNGRCGSWGCVRVLRGRGRLLRSRSGAARPRGGMRGTRCARRRFTGSRLPRGHLDRRDRVCDGLRRGEKRSRRRAVRCRSATVSFASRGAERVWGRHGLELDPPCRVPLAEEHDQDILGCDGDRWVVQQACAEGCYEATTGTPDACVETRTPTNPGWESCAHRERIAYGVHPEASDRLRCSGVDASRITQTIGSAAASAGYHAADGTAEGQPLHRGHRSARCATSPAAQIRALLERLARNGFAAWYRQPGHDGWPSGEAPHIHAVFAGVIMKSQLRAQVRDYLIGRNGLTSHSTYTFYRPPGSVLDIVRLSYSRHYTPP